MPGTPKAKQPKKLDARYEAFRAEWERRRKAPDRDGGEWLVDKPELPVDPLPFLQTLRRLGYVTQDDRFIKLHRYFPDEIVVHGTEYFYDNELDEYEEARRRRGQRATAAAAIAEETTDN